MKKVLSIPPKSKSLLSPPELLAKRLNSLIGIPFNLTGKPRSDGSGIRKIIESTLLQFPLPEPCPDNDYRIVPPKGKGVPKILREFLETYIVTTGSSYNLQVWNRNPSANSIQVEYEKSDPLLSKDVRFVFVRVDPNTEIIRSIVILTPDYVVERFGKFGKPTIKHQLIITPKTRNKILSSNPPIVFYPDHPNISEYIKDGNHLKNHNIHETPTPDQLLKLDRIKDLVLQHLIGSKLEQASTKNRGQALELKISNILGYQTNLEQVLAGGYPDIRHQALEVKIQDSPTVDLGKYSPQFDENVPLCPNFSTSTIRYLIALTNPIDGTVEGAVICPGEKLGEHFSYVADTSFKCQRSIPMEFFDSFDGKVVINP